MILALAVALPVLARADATYFPLASGSFSQNWSNTGQITVNDDWSGVPSIVGFLGQDITTGTGTDPQTLTGTSAVANDLDAIANQTNTGITNGGVAEFQLADPVVALQGSGTADAPYLLLHLNTTGRTAITVSYNLRDIDGTTDNAIQQVALQYRVGTSGPFINLPAGYVADAATGPSLATLVTPVSVVLPAAADNQSQVQVRIMTTNAVGNDEWVGIDDILVTSTGGGTTPPSITLDPLSQTVTAGTTVQFTAGASGSAPLGFQWYKGAAPLADDGIHVSGSQSLVLTLNSVTTGDDGSYTFVATNGAGTATSAAATLTVNTPLTPPHIDIQPLPQTVAEGGTATFTVAASGTAPLAYQWRKNTVPLTDGAPISGATTATLTVVPVSPGDAGSYDVVVTNGINPPATSDAVALTVTPPAPVTGTATWNFGTGSELATPSSNPVDFAGGALTRGNNNGTTNTLFNITSASNTYAGASGAFNAGAAARIGGLNSVTDGSGSAYFEFTLTPVDNKELTVNSIAFGSRSTGTGPQAWTLYSSLDGFTSQVATGTLTNNSTWTLVTVPLTGLSTGAGLDVTFRLFGHGGAGGASANTSNWRIDDLKVTGTTVVGPPVPPAVTAVAPANGAAGVLPNAAVKVTFNRPVLTSAAAFTLTGSLSGAHAFTLTGSGKSYTLTPTAPYALGETVSLTVLAAGVTNLSGSLHPAADYTSTFDTLSPVPVPIHTVQGSGPTSPAAGQTLVVQGVVIAAFQDAGGVGGYYIEAPQAEWDGDTATSEGILVFDNTNTVAVGDVVKVAGTVVEFGTAPATETEISPVYVFEKLATGEALPPAAEVALPFPAAGFAERYEGMLVTFPQALTVTDTFDLGHFGELMLSSQRLPQPTNVVAPGAPAQALLAQNLLDQVLLDDAKSPAYPDPTPYLSSADPATATRRAGSVTTGVTGVFGHKFGAYVVEPTAPVSFDAVAGARPPIAPAAGPGLRVAIGNVLNFFNGNGSGLDGTDGGFPTSRGANTLAEYQAQRAKIVAGILGLAPDIMGLTEVENDRVTNNLANSYGPTSAIADIVNGLNAGAPAGTTYAYVDASAEDIVSDVIHCAFIYRVETVAPVGPAKVLDDVSFTGVNIGIARNPQAQTFQQLANGEKLTVCINHFKSKGSATADVGGGGAALNADTGDGQGASNYVRKLQAQALVNWLAGDPTGSGDPDFLIIGDLNAYAKEDPVAIIEGAGYINLTEASEGEGGYSYSFDGQFGHLDHALANGHLAGQVIEAGTWHVNSDEPEYYDYNAEDKSAAQRLINAGTPYRYSDHDPVVVRLNLQPDPVAPVIVTPPQPQTVTVGDSVTFSVTATGVPPPTYQWRHNGVAIDGATGASYTIASPTTADAGAYDVVVINGSGFVISVQAVLAVNPAAGGVVLSDLTHVYDGSPHPAVATTTPTGLPVNLTYNGSATPPTAPGWYDVVATINSPDYTGGATGQLFIDVTALVKHLPQLDGRVRGSVHLVTAENATLNSNGSITGDLLVPGLPTLRLNGSPTYGGTLDGTGAATPATALITLNSSAKLRHVVRRTPAQALPGVAAPPAPTGTRNVSINSAGQSPGDFATIRNLTLNSGAGQVTLPAGTYGALTANGSSSFVLGTAGATVPAVYNLQGLTLNGTSRLVIAGPVIINLASGTGLNGSVGATGHPEWVELNIASGGLTLNSNINFTGFVTAPSGTVTINGGSTLTGRIVADRLTINSTGLLVDPAF